MLTFCYSVPNKLKGVNLPEFPVQIIPYSRTRIIEQEINCYPIRSKNNGGIVHSTYLCRPFGKKLEQFDNINVLRTYKTLCERIKYNFLVHGPANDFEMSNLEKGFSILREVFKDFNQKVLIEIPSFNSGFKIPVPEYLEKILSEFPEGSKFEICLDTAHMFANGCQTNDIIEICKRFEKYVSVIHLNGNEKEQFQSDVHVEIFNPESKMKNIKEMMQYFVSKKFLLVAEIRRGKYGYSDWKKFCDSYNLPIVDFSEKLIINGEKIL